MVLVAPDPRIHGHSRGTPTNSAPVRATDARADAQSMPSAAVRSARDALLAALRGGPAPRPRFDPSLAGGLRAWLEDAAFDLVARRGESAAPVFLGAWRLLGDPDPAPAPAPQSQVVPTVDAMTARLVHALFRQLVTVGALDDPWRDALDAIGVDGGPGDIVRHIEGLPKSARNSLRRAVSSHATHLCDLVPHLSPGWMPRTDDRVAVALAGGHVVLHGAFDLLVGVPEPAVASLCAVGLSTSTAGGHERRRLHYLALLETLRSGTPPYRLALIESATGRYRVEDVRVEHLRAMAAHVVDRLRDPACA